MARHQTLTAVAAVVVFGVCAALPFYKSGGPGHTVLELEAGVVESVGLSSVPHSANPPLRVPPDATSVPRDPSPVALLDHSRDVLGVAIPEDSPPRIAPHLPSQAANGARVSPPARRPLRGRVRRESAPPPTVQPLPRFQRHIVVDGDNLENLAVTYLGTADRAHEISELNRDRRGCEHLDRILPLGIELYIPAR